MLRDVLLPTPFACGDPFAFRDGGYADVHVSTSGGNECFMCDRGLQTQCETTQVREQGSGAALFGYSQLYGSVPGGQAQYLRVPHADSTHIKVPQGPADERFVCLSDVLPTAWQAVEYAEIPDGGTVTVLGLGPIGDMAGRIAGHRGARVIAVDLVPERLARDSARGRTGCRCRMPRMRTTSSNESRTAR
jgi:threonine dehydrogenase-like Zn-dependent dehydrogenase